jgi:hypothetical protein
VSKREQIFDNYVGVEELMFLEPEYFDEAIIGVASSASGVIAVAYSEPQIIKLLMQHDKMDPDEAMEWYQFNILGSFMGESTPIFIDDTVLE